jgi:uroporphyrin-3 C-methyltransferase
VWAEARSLVRVTRIDMPEAMLVAPEQAFFLRENLKLRLLNARLALLSRQFDIAQSDLRDAQSALERYFDRGSRRVTTAIDSVRQITAQARTVTVPRPDATLAAITAAAAGR